jgi:RNA polymerase sigma factor (sigma-70 family)
MTQSPLGKVIEHLRHKAGADGVRELTDRQLLERFTADQEEAAFAALVQRHGPLVLGICRRVLHNEHDAEDVFQATFLVLVRKAPAIRKWDSVGSWLHGVAYRTALKARGLAARRHVQERKAEAPPSEDPEAELVRRELRAVLDEELDRLPEKYRAPLVLCYFEGKSYDEAARHLGWKNGTVCGRLARARELLRTRLVRRGLALTGAALATALSPSSLQATVPAELTAGTFRAGLLFAAGESAAGAVSANAAILTRGVLKTMFLSKLKIAAAVIMAAGLAGTGAGVFTFDHLAAAQPSPKHEPGTGLAARDDEEKNDEAAQKEAADRIKVSNSLKQIGLALHTYHDANGRFPTNAVYDKDGQALLSWRVAILPYIDEGDLYNQFHLDEAWDSDHNKKLLAKMPQIYAPIGGKPKEKNATYYQGFVGNGAFFEGQQGRRMADITDGTSNTVMIIEAADAVPWTKPTELKFDPDKDLPKLGGHFKKGFYALFADGSVQRMRDDYDAKTMKAAITVNGGEVINQDLIHE